jgi:LmbE family N-acetylglucosaminyl deacetylase
MGEWMDRSTEDLWRALQPLRSVARWLMTGAHPDDEWSGFLAWLAFGRSVHTIYTCATRGEAGQNALGPAHGAALGALRLREMECAAQELGLTLRWLGRGYENGMDDPIFDFGFSKSAEDTLARWGKERLIARLVRLIRTERPDAISPTFLDVSGQHGHHRAITRCTLEAAALAADAAYHVPAPSPGVWCVPKIYLPAFAGSGASYEDEGEPPPETVSVDLGARCEALAASWAQLGERSRYFHRSQGMGREVPDGPSPFSLHLVSGIPDAVQPLDGVAHRLRELAGLLPERAAALALRETDTAIDDAVSAFPDRTRVADALHRALASLAHVALPSGADDIVQRLKLKRRQLGRAAALALGVDTPPADACGSDSPVLPPAVEVTVAPRHIVRRADSDTPVVVTLTGAPPPPSWPVLAAANGRVEITTPVGRSVLPSAGKRLRQVHYPHTGPVIWLESAEVTVLRAQIAIDPDAHVGVVAGDADETLDWLRQLDIAACPVDDEALEHGNLDRFTTLLVGICAFGQRPALLHNRDRLTAWTNAGGSLVTLYHRPSDGWHEGRSLPLRIVIGSPSIRWRVTNPAAPVTVLAPQHPLLQYPNKIGPADWENWVRERGLYFAREWDSTYVPLLEIADPWEQPLRGALLTASVGRGRHVHVALALHHQLSALVPGAFRLLANLVSRPPASP